MATQVQSKRNGTKATTRRPKKSVREVTLLDPTTITITASGAVPAVATMAGGATVIWVNKTSKPVQIDIHENALVDQSPPVNHRLKFTIPPNGKHSNKAKVQLPSPAGYDYTVTLLGGPSAPDDRGPPTIIIW